jgi:hypothetical protein
MHTILDIIVLQGEKVYRCFVGFLKNNEFQRQIQELKLGGGANLKKLLRAKGGAKIVGVFRVKNHDFTPTNHLFFQF